MSEQYIRPKQACKLLKVTTRRTLYNWDEKELIPIIRNKMKIWKDNLSSLEASNLIMKLSLITDQRLTSKEKVLTPFWTQ